MVRNPQEVLEQTYQMAASKQAKSWKQIALLAVMAGAYIALGGFLSLLVGKGFPALSADNPALGRLLSGAMFPIGLILVVATGAELFTSNNAVLIPAVVKGQIPWHYPLKLWSVVYVANFVGALGFAYGLIHLTGLADAEPWHSALLGVAQDKVSLPWHVVFLRGVGANWLVCLAVWLGLAAKDFTGKILGLWWPVMAFVALGFEHSIANMFYIPLAIFQGAPIGWDSFVLDNLIPATLGNILGGALLVGSTHYYVFGRSPRGRGSLQNPRQDQAEALTP